MNIVITIIILLEKRYNWVSRRAVDLAPVQCYPGSAFFLLGLGFRIFSNNTRNSYDNRYPTTMNSSKATNTPSPLKLLVMKENRFSKPSRFILNFFFQPKPLYED